LQKIVQVAHGYSQMSRFVVMSNAVGYLHRIALIILILQGGISAGAQQNWFLYIQSESSQSFYVRIGEKIYSSSPVGHLVINGLRDSTYRLAIGFPQSLYREHQFVLPVRKKDHGFELKKSDARTWILYDWQDQETIRSPRTDSLLYGERKKDDGFASLMAAVVNDSAVLYASVVKADPPKKIAPPPTIDSAVALKQVVEKKPDSVVIDSAIVSKDTKKEDSIKTEQVVVKNNPVVVDSVVKKPDTAAVTKTDTTAIAVSPPPKEEDKTPAVAKMYEQTINSEKKLVFLDNTIGIKKDTITIIIPLEKDSVLADTKTAAKPEVVKDSVIIKPDSSELKARTVVKEETIKPKTDSNDRKAEKTNAAQTLMDSIASLKKVDTAKVVKAEMKKIDSPAVELAKEPEPEKPAGLVMVNSDCSRFATDNEVDKLRVKMMNEKDAGNRIFIAHKLFKSMCFTTRQIKGLSELFPNDELRFRFFETAWPFVSDTVNFKSLEETLTDAFFITRFRTLLKRQ
jgi:hypothetical protein